MYTVQLARSVFYPSPGMSIFTPSANQGIHGSLYRAHILMSCTMTAVFCSLEEGALARLL